MSRDGYADISLWHETAGDSWEPRPALMGDVEVDVAIVGAGYTGLWTAYYLTEARPDLRIAILEAEVAGFGASGRNGGWCSALFPASLDKVAAASSREAALAQDRAMRATVDEVIRVAEAEGIEADIAKGGTITLARTQAQLERAKTEVEHARSWGLGEAELALLDRAGAERRLAATDTLGGTYTPDCASIHPAKLVRGLARVVESRGVTIYEQTRATAIEPHRVLVQHSPAERDVVTADVVVRATEGYTPTLAGLEREVIPVRSLIIATEPLSDLVWSSIGLEERETFSDGRHLLIYGQRTADDRLVFGGRGAPYSFGSRITHADASDLRTHRRLLTTLIEMFPAVRGHQVTHRWGGVLAIPRDWHASVGYDPASGLAHAGGYVGDGVATTNLAGRTLRDLILGTPSDLTALPWVGHVSPRWEPEPLRWLGVNAGLRAMTVADAEESATGKGSLVARAVAPLVGGH
ncbi:FAD-dependent oxidoreductase [Nocardioides sp.]|uniref:NAD(P)/FAD-dependent oxidoreductase n=1 Tax=Nocardioides sp. TaxID=35761 RepID=UPI0025DE7890|nr:FAD-dependent oxidoreductase [Nocardioides sp.]